MHPNRRHHIQVNHTQSHPYTYTHTNACALTYNLSGIHAYINMQTYANVRSATYIHSYIHQHTYMHTGIQANTYTCIKRIIVRYTYTLIYIHTGGHAAVGHTYTDTPGAIRQTGTHTLTPAYIQENIHTYIHTGRQADRQTTTHTYGNHIHPILHTYGHTYIHTLTSLNDRMQRGIHMITGIHTSPQAGRQAYIQGRRQTGTQKDNHTYIQPGRQAFWQASR